MPTAKISPAAVLHYAAGALKPGEVPVGFHDLSQVSLRLVCPRGAGVERKEGRGDGLEEYQRQLKAPSLLAVLLFLRAAGPAGPEAVRQWIAAIRSSLLVEQDPEFPEEALAALKQVNLEIAGELATRRTAARRVNLDGAKLFLNGRALEL